MKTLDLKRLNSQIYSEASYWLVEFRTGDIGPSDRKTFTQWLRTSPEHVRAYLEVAAIWNEGAQFDSDRRFDDDTLVQSALSEHNVITLGGAVPYETVPGTGGLGAGGTVPDNSAVASIPASQQLFFARYAATVAATLVVLVGITTWLSLFHNVYSTDTGEQRSMALADGTHIELNARSKIRVNYNDTERHIDLLEGQAYFHVAIDKARPFVVASGDTQVRAVGTKFDVYRKSSATIVTVVEGRVAVASTYREPAAPTKVEAPSDDLTNSTQARELLVLAGQQIVVRWPSKRSLSGTGDREASGLDSQNSVAEPQAVDITAATAWTRKQLVFDSVPLGEVANEFNRYNQRPLIITSKELDDLHITGIFSSTDPASLLRFLEARPGILVTERENGILIEASPES